MEDDTKTTYNYKLFVPLLLSLSAATRAAGTSVVFAPTDTTIHYREPAPVQYTQDYYKILEVEYDASDEKIRLNYRKLALKWHPDKHKCNDAETAKFQEINEAYSVLSDPDKRLDYDLNGNYEINNYTLPEYLARFKGMILTCNGLGISQDSVWSEQLTEINKLMDK